MPALVTISAHQKVGEAIDVMQRYSISQLPVVRDGELGSLADVIGSLQDRDLLDRVFKNADALHEDVASAMQPPLATVEASASVDEIVRRRSPGGTNAVLVARGRPPGRRRHALRPARVPRAQPVDARRASAALTRATSSRTRATQRASGARTPTTSPPRSGGCRPCSSTRSRPSTARTGSRSASRIGALRRGGRLARCCATGASSSTGRTRRACSRSRTTRCSSGGWPS